MNSRIAWVALVGAVLAGGCAPASSESPENTATPTNTSSSPSLTTREYVERVMDSDPWYSSLPSDALETIHQEAAQLCGVADEELTYGEAAGGSRDLTYTRTLVMQLGLSGGVGAAGKGDDAADSARKLILTYVRTDCPDHEQALKVVMDEQYDVIFGTALNDS